LLRKAVRVMLPHEVFFRRQRFMGLLLWTQLHKVVHTIAVMPTIGTLLAGIWFMWSKTDWTARQRKCEYFHRRNAERVVEETLWRTMMSM
jgi:phosphate/sulfate permease